MRSKVTCKVLMLQRYWKWVWHTHARIFPALSNPPHGALRETSGLHKLTHRCLLGQLDHCCYSCNTIGKKGIALINRSSFCSRDSISHDLNLQWFATDSKTWGLNLALGPRRNEQTRKSQDVICPAHVQKGGPLCEVNPALAATSRAFCAC